MPAWAGLIGIFVSASVAALSFLGNREAQRTGRLRFLFWHIRGWGEREQSPAFFGLGIFMNYWRTGFFALLTVMFSAYFLEALGFLH